jgi:DNA-directed RNA polymerase
MDWYKQVALCFMDEGIWIHWVNPIGFKVTQDYRKVKMKRIRMIGGDFQKQIMCATDDGATQDRRRNANGLSPNITHSWDSAHMAMICDSFGSLGFPPFSGIHDSFGALPCHIPTLFRIIREEFVKLYENYSTVTELQRAFKVATGKDLPPPPTKGSLDIRDVLQNNFAFA